MLPSNPKDSYIPAKLASIPSAARDHFHAQHPFQPKAHFQRSSFIMTDDECQALCKRECDREDRTNIDLAFKLDGAFVCFNDILCNRQA
jgi:hypothetical protein